MYLYVEIYLYITLHAIKTIGETITSKKNFSFVCYQLLKFFAASFFESTEIPHMEVHDLKLQQTKILLITRPR